jgi:hypothetical protein
MNILLSIEKLLGNEKANQKLLPFSIHYIAKTGRLTPA